MSPRLALAALLLCSAAFFAACRTPGVHVTPAPRLKVNVFVEPSEELADKVRAVAAKVERETGVATFPTHDFLVHCTLFMSDYPSGEVAQIEERVARAVRGVRAFPLQSEGFSVTPDGWLFLQVGKSDPLVALNERLAEALADLRDPDQPPPSWLRDPAGLERFRRYGTPGVGPGFFPHFTLLARGPKEQLDALVARTPKSEVTFSGDAVAVGIAIADENGQMREKRTTFALPR